MRLRSWLICLASVVLWGCSTPGGDRPVRPIVQPLTLVDCDAVFPHLTPADQAPDPQAASTPGALADGLQQRLDFSRYARCSYGNAKDRKVYYSTLGSQLRYDQADLLAQVADFKQRQDATQATIASYKADCGPQQHLTQKQYSDCVARQSTINNDVAYLNAQMSKFQSEAAVLNASVKSYDQDIPDVDSTQQSSYETYKTSLQEQAKWLDAARAAVSRGGNYEQNAIAAGCPEVTQAAKTSEAMDSMSQAVVTCLRHFAGAP